MTGQWLEQLTPGLRVRHAATRTVTETDNILFATGLVVGLAVPELTLGTTVANLGFSAVEFPVPVFPGDTIHVVTDVVEARRSRSRPDNGVVTFAVRAD